MIKEQQHKEVKTNMTKNICEIVGRKINPTTKRETKMRLVSECINTSRYAFTMVNGSTVKLKPRFHNLRNSKGQWTARRA
jgi:hypothetical protein